MSSSNYVSPSVLVNLKEELVVTGLINRLEIANGLKKLLINNGLYTCC